MIKEIYLIGGAPRTGKSTLAKQIAKKTGAEYLALDDLRNFIKALKPQAIPASNELYYDDNLEIEEFYKKYSEPEQVFELEKSACSALEPAIEFLIENFYNWQKVVIEGIGITPELIAKLSKKYNAKGFVLAVKNPEVINQRIYSNGLWDNENNYSDIYKEKEEIWANLYSDWVIEEAKINRIVLIYEDELSLNEVINKLILKTDK